MIEAHPTETWQAFDFSNEELAMNRSGMLSIRQQVNLQRETREYRVRGRIWLILLAILALILLAIPMLTEMPEQDQTAYIASSVGILTGCSLLFVIGIVRGKHQASGVSEPRLKAVRGRAALRTERERTDGIDWMQFLLVVDEVEFQLTPKQYASLTHNSAYCVYYVTHALSHHVVSLAPVLDAGFD